MSNLQRLRDNIKAISHALKSTSEYDTNVLNLYTGFGGLGFVLNPLDKSQWTKTDLCCYDDTVRLHELLREEAGDEKQYKRWVASLKASTLTAFYTPWEFMLEMVGKVCAVKGVTPKVILDPAAGSHAMFMNIAMINADMRGENAQGVAYEKDLLSGLILSHAHNDRQDIRIDGFEHFPDEELGCYDLVSTNVPFGNIAVFDDAYSNSALEVRQDAARMIHRYYVLKGLDALREGGIEAYIITSNYLNNDTEQVAYALQQARLIGAYRLANNLFRENGTEVGTDLLVLQKDTKRGPLTEDERLLTTRQEVEGCPYNAYFVKRNDHIIATEVKKDTDAYGKPGLVFSHKDGVKGIAEMLGRVLSKDMQERCDAGLFEKGRADSAAHRTTDAQPVTVVVESTDGDKIAGQQTKGAAKKGKRMTKQEAALKDLHVMYTKLYEYEQTYKEEDSDRRENLNYLYDSYCDKYGRLNINSKEMARRMNIADVLALEVKDEQSGKWTKADIMLRPVAFSTEEKTGVLTAREALAQSLNEYGRPMMQYIAGLCGLEADELIRELEGEVFWNPLCQEWEIKAKFISGDVITKAALIAQRTEQLGETDNRITASLEALRAAVPTPIPFEQLDFNLGERWVDAAIYERFAQDFFTMGDSRPEIQVRYQKAIDMYAVACRSSSNEKIRSQYSVKSECSNRIDGIDLLTHALHNSTPELLRYKRDKRGCIVTKQNSKGEDEEVKEADPEAMQIANDKIDEIRQGYCDWLLRQDKATQDKLAAEYNRRYNCTVKPQYDGGHLTLSDVDWDGVEQKYGFRSPYKSQLDAIWMIILLGGGIVDHEVGGGKTFIMCAACHEMKRLGLVHKPLIIGMKANVSAIAEMYATMYPQDKLLYASKADYSAKNRVDFFNRMRNNDYDCIVMSHDQFMDIPQSAEIEEELLDDELQQLEDALNALEYQEGYEVTKKQRKGLELRKRNLEAKIKKQQAEMRARKDDVVDFQMMGIDMLFVDESHEFKNLRFTTRHDRVSGIGNTKGSDRATNLLMALRTIQRRSGKDLGAVFLSGTTISNSLTELYALFRYLRPKALERQGITCFDAWAAIYTRKSSEWEFDVTNQIKLKERFRYFVKVPELAMFYNEITDYRTAEDVGLERPKMNRMLLKLQPTEDQEAYFKTLMEFARTRDFSLVGKAVTDKQAQALMLYATNLARKAALDMREIDPQYGDDPGNKATQCAVLLKRYYDAFNPVKGVQLVFCDLSTWKGKSAWSVYAEIKDKLVDMGVPPEEVRFIQEAADNENKKKRMIQMANEGKIRVLFGSTKNLGTGVNVQDRIVAIHELDTPWRPSDLEQREGRGVRKGNWVAKQYAGNKVDVIIYAVERSLDAYKFHLLHCKSVFISQLKRSQLATRTLDEGDMDEKSGMSFAEYTAVLSGNTDLLERAKLEKKIAAMESAKKLFYREQAKQEQQLRDLEHEVKNLERDIPDCQQDIDRYEAAKEHDEFGQVINCLELRGCSVPDGISVGSVEWAKAVGTRLLEIDRDTDTGGNYQTLGTIYGFELLMRTDIIGTRYEGDTQIPFKANKYFLKAGRILYSYGDGTLDHRSYSTAVKYPMDVLQQRLPSLLAQWQQRLAQHRQSIGQLQSIATEEWGKDDDLLSLKKSLADLDRRIKRSLDSSQEQQAAAQQSDDEPLPVKFEKDGRDHKATWQRDVFGLVSNEEMRDIIKALPGWRNYLYNTDGWTGDHMKAKDEWTAEFTTSKHAADFIERIERLQKQRMADRDWLAKTAAEDTHGDIVTIDNCHIFAARKALKALDEQVKMAA